MTSRERVLAAAIGKEPDILPVAPYMGNHGARVAGEKLRNYYTNPRKLAEAQLKAWEIYGQDVIVAQSDNYYMAEAFGCRVKYHENSTPHCLKDGHTRIIRYCQTQTPQSSDRWPYACLSGGYPHSQ